MKEVKIALVFPGQGSQFVGMGLELYNSFPQAKEVFQEIDEAIEFNLSKIIFEGDENELRKTENTQAALMAVSVATARVLENLSGKKITDFTSILAGHSLGEYSALCLSSSVSLKDTAILLRKRGLFMASAMPAGGGMAAIIGAKDDAILDLINKASQGEVLVVANDNSVGQVVLSGHISAIERALSLAKECGAKMAIKLEVSGPFHSPLLLEASIKMKEELEKINFQIPKIKTISNVSLDFYQSSSQIQNLLAKQIISQVRWRETMIKMKEEGISKVFELGASKVLCGLFKRTVPEIECFNAGKPDEIESLIKVL